RATFDKNIDLQQDIEITMVMNGNELTDIMNGSTPLIRNTDYTVSDNIVTIKKSYLSARENGSLILTFDFSAGSDRNLTLTIKETIPLPLTSEYVIGPGFDASIVKSALGTGTAAFVAAGAGGKTDVLEIAINATHNYEVVSLPFNIGTDKLSDYTSIEIELAASYGDATHKPFSAYVAPPGGKLTHCNSDTTNLKITASANATGGLNEWKTWKQALTLNAESSNITGEFEIGIGIPAYYNAGLKYQIKSIKLVK
ncbi:MAG: hypothetical protein LBR68_07915, partial [Lachnoclostridium sp.]|nr:hypothetical protein [Lachnoclostridium sp.]